MRQLARWMLASTLIGVAFAAGCSPAPVRVVTELPSHDLDIAPAPSVAESIPAPVAVRPVQPPRPSEWSADGYRNWRYIVIHHSATDAGNAKSFDKAHRKRGWDGLGYHFVIDNGNGGPDGRIEVGPRWRRQKWGAHCGGTPNNEYNNHGIGICLVGDFSDRLPSPSQQRALERLLLYLMTTYDIDPQNVIGHCDAPHAKTACPGEALNEYVHGRLRHRLASRN